MGKKHVAIDPRRRRQHATRGPAAFICLVLSHDAYTYLGGDPFALSDRFPPTWESSGELSVITCPAEPPPRRTVEDIQALFARGTKMMQPTLLGAVQALIDEAGVWSSPLRPAPDLIRGAVCGRSCRRNRRHTLAGELRLRQSSRFQCTGGAPRAEGAASSPGLIAAEEQAGDSSRRDATSIACRSPLRPATRWNSTSFSARRTRPEVLRLALLLVGAAVLPGSS